MYFLLISPLKGGSELRAHRYGRDIHVHYVVCFFFTHSWLWRRELGRFLHAPGDRVWAPFSPAHLLKKKKEGGKKKRRGRGAYKRCFSNILQALVKCSIAGVKKWLFWHVSLWSSYFRLSHAFSSLLIRGIYLRMRPCALFCTGVLEMVFNTCPSFVSEFVGLAGVCELKICIKSEQTCSADGIGPVPSC